MNTEAKTFEEVEDAQKLLDDAGLSNWRATHAPGMSGDPLAYFRATRVAPGGIREVTHREARVLVNLCREVDLRLASTEPRAVATGTLDTETIKSTGGA